MVQKEIWIVLHSYVIRLHNCEATRACLIMQRGEGTCVSEEKALSSTIPARKIGFKNQELARNLKESGDSVKFESGIRFS
jgi:hypothetical protein